MQNWEKRGFFSFFSFLYSKIHSFQREKTGKNKLHVKFNSRKIEILFNSQAMYRKRVNRVTISPVRDNFKKGNRYETIVIVPLRRACELINWLQFCVGPRPNESTKHPPPLTWNHHSLPIPPSLPPPPPEGSNQLTCRLTSCRSSRPATAVPPPGRPPFLSSHLADTVPRDRTAVIHRYRLDGKGGGTRWNESR